MKFRKLMNIAFKNFEAWIYIYCYLKFKLLCFEGIIYLYSEK